MTAALTTMTFEVRDGVGYVVLTRPERLNSITEDTFSDLDRVLDRIDADPRIRAAVIRGSEQAFCVGLDLDLLRRAFDDTGYFRSVLERLKAILLRIERLDVPVLAVVNGLARAGGLELILACDLVLVADDAKIGDNHTNFAVMPGGGATVRLPHRIGEQRARELIFTARWLSGVEAAEYGLALRSVPSDRLDAEAESLLDLLRDKSRQCSGAVKRSMRRSAALSVDDGVDVEVGEFMAYVTPLDSDAREGFQAYLENRTPSWRA